MCDLYWLIGLLTTVGALIAAAAAAVGVASALNGGFFSAPAAPAAMVTASVTSGIAAGMLGIGVRVAIDDFFRCMGSPPECAQLLTDLQGVIAGLATVLLVQAVAAGVVAAVAWVPWAAQPGMLTILGALLLQLPLIPSAIALTVALIDCAKEASVGVIVRPLLVGAIVTSLAVTAAIYVIRSRIAITEDQGKVHR